MNKKLLTGIGIVILAIVGVGIYLSYKTVKLPVVVKPASTTFDPRNASYIIDNQTVKLVDGHNETAITPGSASKTITAIFGEPVVGDLNGDSLNDAAIMLTVDSGGSGTFFYVAADINSASGGQGTNAVLVGDRIAPQNISIQNGKILANYAIRNPGEPITTQPSLGVSDYFTFNGSVLAKVIPATPTITYLTSSAQTTKYCDGANMDSAGFQKTLTVVNTTNTLEANPTLEQTVRETINAATSGMCKTALSQVNITVSNGTVYIPELDGWAGISIAMCSCKPQVEVNALRIPGITKVVWSANTDKSDLIRVDYPQPGQTVPRQFIVKGSARGTWYFEASFPVVLTDANGNTLATGIAKAGSNWMTTDFVPFTATLSYSLPKTSSSNKGLLTLKRDNPSGLPQYYDAIKIPVLLTAAPATTPAVNDPVVCTMEAKMCPDGITYVGRTGPKCEFSPCPVK